MIFLKSIFLNSVFYLISLLFISQIASAFEDISPILTKALKRHNIEVIDYNKLSSGYFQFLESGTPIAFPDGCHAKAQKISMMFETNGIKTGKVFIEGGIFFKSRKFGLKYWTFHVATISAVKENDKIKLYVLDPLLFAKPVEYQKWFDEVTKDKRTKVNEVYLTNRFVYSNLERYDELTDYDPVLINDMEEIFRQAKYRLDSFVRK